MREYVDLIREFLMSDVNFDNLKLNSITKHFPQKNPSRDVMVRFVPDENRNPVIDMIWCGARELRLRDLKRTYFRELMRKNILANKVRKAWISVFLEGAFLELHLSGAEDDDYGEFGYKEATLKGGNPDVTFRGVKGADGYPVLVRLIWGNREIGLDNKGSPLSEDDVDVIYRFFSDMFSFYSSMHSYDSTSGLFFN